MEKKIKIIRDILSRKKIADYEIYLEQGRELTIEVKEGKVDAMEEGMTSGFALRVLSGQKIGVSYGTDFSQKALEAAVAHAFESSAHTTPHPHHGWPAPAKSYPSVSNLDASLSSIPLRDKIEAARILEAEALRADPAVKRVRYATYAEAISEIRLVNSLGADLIHRRSFITQSLMAVASKGEDSEMAYDTQSSPFWKDLNPALLAKKTALEAASQLGGKRISNYRGPIILAQNVASEMLSLLAPSTSAENIHKKNSFLIGKKGKKIYADGVTLIDDGLYEKGGGASPFDDEGTPRQKTPVIEKGVVRQFLYDTFWGKEEGVPSTGNASREGIAGKVRPDITHFYLEPGKFSQDELLSRMGEGVLVTQAIGMHTADPISGDFSVGMGGFRVKNGKKDHPIRSVALTGNLHDLFAKVTEVGSDLKFDDNIGSPSLLLSDASVAGE
ncbi:MAG: TldD/PmbA family protein [Deltaproteobacteria bacterium]|nr:TldD/PmbA family protein [Deltaproteobacteria bacterium]